MEFFAVFFRYKDQPGQWRPAEEAAYPDSYWSYPILHRSRESAEEFAKKFDGIGAETKTETKVVPILIYV